MVAIMATGKFTIGSVTFDAERGTLARDGKTESASQRGIALLQALLMADGQPVNKSVLLEAAWPGQIVEEGNLTVQIAALRKALGPMPDGGDWIVTVPRVGYRLLQTQAKMVAEPIMLPSLAVLPFQNLSGDPEQDYFADGVVEDIITALARFKSFAVIARNSSFTYKGRAVDVRQVASELGVRYVLEGSVQKAGNRLRITAQLVEGSGGTQIWTRNFDGAVDDVFDFQDTIANSVATLVEPHIQGAEIERSQRERPGSIATYDIYLRALPKLASERDADLVDAYALLTEGLALDPNNALLLALATNVLHSRSTKGRQFIESGDKQKCIELARRGLQYAAGDPTVMAICGMTLLQTARDYDLGMAVIQSAVDANPNSLKIVVHAGIAHLLCGSTEKALDYLHQAARLSPRDPQAHWGLSGIAHVHMIHGNYAEALVWAMHSLATNPNYDPTYWMLIAGHAKLGQMDEARRHLLTFRNLSPEVTIASIQAGQPNKDPNRLAAILDGLRKAGLPEE